MPHIYRKFKSVKHALLWGSAASIKKIMVDLIECHTIREVEDQIIRDVGVKIPTSLIFNRRLPKIYQGVLSRNPQGKNLQLLLQLNDLQKRSIFRNSILIFISMERGHNRMKLDLKKNLDNCNLLSRIKLPEVSYGIKANIKNHSMMTAKIRIAGTLYQLIARCGNLIRKSVSFE